MRKFIFNSRSIGGFVQVLVVLVLAVAFIILLNSLLVSRGSQTASQLQQPVSQSLSSTPETDVSPIDPDVGWKTFRDEQLGLSFNYPSDWEVKIPSTDQEAAIHTLLELAPREYKDNEAPIKLFYYDNPENSSLEELDRKLTGTSGISPGLYSQDDKSVVMSNGITAYYSKEHYCVSLCQTYVWQLGNRVLQLINYPRSIPNQNQIFEGIFQSTYNVE